MSGRLIDSLRGQKCLPIYKRLEAELATYRALERDMAAVRERKKIKGAASVPQFFW
ncbi:hypothetical protein [Rhizobium laguerreae]|uniref:hypothetical protein n=1 Tax=Rhizobium laguerreae TaxID=1076926 RepID=UPI001ABFEC92|nr:hypothetical protein [Rhizobium laguerreae]